MAGQDTGSAIIGPARADIYFGAGEEAGRIGGRIKHPGRFVMLVPREVDPFENWRNVPLPPIKEARAVAAAEPELPPAAPAVAAPGPTARPKPKVHAQAAAPPKAAKSVKTGQKKAVHAKKTATREAPAKLAPKPAASKSPLSGLAKLFTPAKSSASPAKTKQTAKTAARRQ
jgi:membrane-bound lytic murein transglycosylase A